MNEGSRMVNVCPLAHALWPHKEGAAVEEVEGMFDGGS